MILIAHRGNTNGVNSADENKPEYIRAAADSGYHVEVDVWFIEGEYLLGHDEPLYKVEESFLENENFWCHAKNLEALEAMVKNKRIHCFWHQSDDFVLTSRGYIWTQPGKPCGTGSICVLPEGSRLAIGEVKPAGICADDFSFLDTLDTGTGEKFDYVEIGSSCFKTMAGATRGLSSVKGISVEPVTEYLEELKSSMKKYASPTRFTAFVNAAIGASTESRDFYFFDWYEFSKNGLSNLGLTGIGSFDRKNVEHEVIKQLGKEYLVHIKSRSIPCLSFEKFANDYNIGEIDILKIDAEGYDGVVIRSMFNQTEVRPKVIIFERLIMKRNYPDDLEDLDKFIKDQDYCVTDYGNAWNSICIRREPGLFKIPCMRIEHLIEETTEGLGSLANKIRKNLKGREKINAADKEAFMKRISRNKLVLE